MLTFIYGSDYQLVQTELNKLLNDYSQSDIQIFKNLKSLSGIAYSSQQISLFNSTQVYVIYTDNVFDTINNFQTNQEELIALKDASILTIIVSYDKPSSAKQIQTFLNTINVIATKELTSQTKPHYITTIVNKLQLYMEQELLDLLATKLPNNAAIIDNEVTKLKTQSLIDFETINYLISDYEQSNVFNILKYAFTKDVTNLFKTYNNILSNGEDINFLMQMFAVQLAHLYAFATVYQQDHTYQHLHTTLGITYYAYQANKDLLKKIEINQIKNAIHLLNEYDIKIKQNLLDKNNAFKYFLIKLIK